MDIRFIKEGELDELVELCELHAHFEKAEYEKSGKAVQLKNALFVNSPQVFCLVVVENNRLIGYATYMLQYSTWDAAYYSYLDCIFMKEIARGKGFGEQLMNVVKENSKKLGAELIQWQTPDFNIDAMRFYKRLGASSKSKERFFWE